MCEILQWARNEVDLAKKYNAEDSPDDPWMIAYGDACYESALKAFTTFVGDGHSGMSITIAQSFLNRLINLKPLTPIQESDDIWNEINSNEELTLYQCSRMSSLFKTVYADGRIVYSDNDRWLTHSLGDTEIRYYSGLTTRVMDELYPIEMPYFPAAKPFNVTQEDFFAKGEGEEVPAYTAGILYVVDDENSQSIVNKFYKFPEGYSEPVEIDADEYNYRKQNIMLSTEDDNYDD